MVEEIRPQVRTLLLIGNEMGAPHGTPAVRAAAAECLWHLPWVALDVTGDWDALRWERLAAYDTVVLASGGRNQSSGEWRQHACTDEQVAGLTRFLERGGGCVAIHIAASNGNARFLRLLGGTFTGHPPFGRFTVRVVDAESDHPILRGFGASAYEVEDECYRTVVTVVSDPAAVRVLLTSHHPDAEAQIDGKPSAWVRQIGHGRLFYTALGHDERVWRQPAFRRLVAHGLAWAAGDRATVTGVPAD